MAARLTAAIKQAGLNVSAIYSRNPQTAGELAAKHQIHILNSIEELQTSMVFLCVNDDAIAAVADSLIHYRGIVIHTSGSTSSSVLSKFNQYGVLWPVQTMTREGKINFQKTPLCVTASDAETLEHLGNIASILSEKVYILTDEERIGVHLAAVMTNNFINHLASATAQWMENHNLKYEIIVPILRTTMEKLTQQPYNFQQTGPAVRGDQAIIEKHLDMLADEESLQRIYKIITESIQTYAHHR